MAFIVLKCNTQEWNPLPSANVLAEVHALEIAGGYLNADVEIVWVSSPQMCFIDGGDKKKIN